MVIHQNVPEKLPFFFSSDWANLMAQNGRFRFSGQNFTLRERERNDWWIGENNYIDPTDLTNCDETIFFRVLPQKLTQTSPEFFSWWSEVGQVDFGDLSIFSHMCTDHLAPKCQKAENTKSDLQNQPLGPRCSLMAQNVRNTPRKLPCKFGGEKKFWCWFLGTQRSTIGKSQKRTFSPKSDFQP